MCKYVFILMALSAGCTGGANPFANPLRAVGDAVSNASNGATRGQVEIFVKSNHPALIGDIQRGGGPTLSQAFDTANVAQSIRAEHTLRMQSDLALYNANLDALVVAIMVVAG